MIAVAGTFCTAQTRDAGSAVTELTGFADIHAATFLAVFASIWIAIFRAIALGADAFAIVAGLGSDATAHTIGTIADFTLVSAAFTDAGSAVTGGTGVGAIVHAFAALTGLAGTAGYASAALTGLAGFGAVVHTGVVGLVTGLAGGTFILATGRTTMCTGATSTYACCAIAIFTTGLTGGLT
jgi:hypothetical protein